MIRTSILVKLASLTFLLALVGTAPAQKEDPHVALIGKAAPDFKADFALNGKVQNLADLKGKVVLLDFFAVWSEPSRKRMDFLKQLNAKYAAQGLEVVGVGLTYKYRYDPQSNKAEPVKDLPAAEESKGIAAFAKKNAIGWRLGVIPTAVTEEYGVLSLPHTVVLDRAGNVKVIYLASDADDDKKLEGAVQELVKSK